MCLADDAPLSVREYRVTSAQDCQGIQSIQQCRCGREPLAAPIQLQLRRAMKPLLSRFDHRSKLFEAMTWRGGRECSSLPVQPVSSLLQLSHHGPAQFAFDAINGLAALPQALPRMA